MDKNPTVRIVSLFFISLWSYTAMSKLTHYGVNVVQMKSQPLPEWSTGFVAWFVPVAELLLALLLLARKTRFLGLLFSTHLMLLFALYVLYVLHLPEKTIPCSCGGMVSHLGWKGHLWLNSSLFVLGTVATLLCVRAEDVNHST